MFVRFRKQPNAGNPIGVPRQGPAAVRRQRHGQQTGRACAVHHSTRCRVPKDQKPSRPATSKPCPSGENATALTSPSLHGSRSSPEFVQVPDANEAVFPDPGGALAVGREQRGELSACTL